MENEENTGAEETQDTENKGADETQDESQNDGGADKGNGSDQDEAGDGDDKGSGEEDGTDKGKSTDKKPTQKADEEPQTRKRNADFIIARKNAKIAKLQDKAGKGADSEEDESDDDNIDPEDQKVIGKQVEKILSPFIKQQAVAEDQKEIDDFVTQNPDFKPYAAKVAKFAQHPSRAGIPIKTLFYEVAGDDLLKIGADRAKKAGDKAKESGAGGGTNRGNAGGGTKPVSEMSQAEFEAEQNKVRSKPRE